MGNSKSSRSFKARNSLRKENLRNSEINEINDLARKNEKSEDGMAHHKETIPYPKNHGRRENAEVNVSVDKDETFVGERETKVLPEHQIGDIPDVNDHNDDDQHEPKDGDQKTVEGEQSGGIQCCEIENGPEALSVEGKLEDIDRVPDVDKLETEDETIPKVPLWSESPTPFPTPSRRQTSTQTVAPSVQSLSQLDIESMVDKIVERLPPLLADALYDSGADSRATNTDASSNCSPPLNAMSLKHKEVLRSQYLKLGDEVDTEGKLVPFLYQQNILLQHDKEKINAEPLTSKKVQILLDILPKKGSSAFDAFCRGLEINGQDFISKRLTRLHVFLTNAENIKDSQRVDQKFTVRDISGERSEEDCSNMIVKELNDHADLTDYPVQLRDDCLNILSPQMGCVVFPMEFSRVEQLDEYWMILNNKSFYRTFSRQLLSIVLPKELRHVSSSMSLDPMSVLSFEEYISQRRKFTEGKLREVKDAETTLKDAESTVEPKVREFILKERIRRIELQKEELEEDVDELKKDLAYERYLLEKHQAIPPRDEQLTVKDESSDLEPKDSGTGISVSGDDVEDDVGCALRTTKSAESYASPDSVKLHDVEEADSTEEYAESTLTSNAREFVLNERIRRIEHVKEKLEGVLDELKNDLENERSVFEKQPAIPRRDDQTKEEIVGSELELKDSGTGISVYEDDGEDGVGCSLRPSKSALSYFRADSGDE